MSKICQDPVQKCCQLSKNCQREISLSKDFSIGQTLDNKMSSFCPSIVNLYWGLVTKLLVQTFFKILSKSNFCPIFVKKKKFPIFVQHLSKLFGVTTILKEHQSELKCVFTFNFTSHFKQVVIQPNVSSVYGPNILSHPLDGMDSI